MFKSILNFLQQHDPAGNWLECRENKGELRIIMHTLYEWIDSDFIQESKEVNDYLWFINEQLKEC